MVFIGFEVNCPFLLPRRLLWLSDLAREEVERRQLHDYVEKRVAEERAKSPTNSTMPLGPVRNRPPLNFRVPSEEKTPLLTGAAASSEEDEEQPDRKQRSERPLASLT